MAFLQTLYSGSSGNSTVLDFDGGSLLVDMSCSCKKTVEALYETGRAVSDIEAIFITHEHIDHVRGLKIFLKHYPMPVYGPAACLEWLRIHDSVPATAELIPLDDGQTVCLAGARITPFRTQHDSVDCFGYRFDFEGGAAAVATDIGTMTDEVFARLEGCGTVALESNYDEGVLLAGPYPFPLKQRIRSDFGHLSNSDSAYTGVRLAKAGTRQFSLMHLSAENNTPSLALTTFMGLLENYGIEGVTVKAAPRNGPGVRFEL